MPGFQHIHLGKFRQILLLCFRTHIPSQQDRDLSAPKHTDHAVFVHIDIPVSGLDDLKSVPFSQGKGCVFIFHPVDPLILRFFFIVIIGVSILDRSAVDDRAHGEETEDADSSADVVIVRVGRHKIIQLSVNIG